MAASKPSASGARGRIARFFERKRNAGEAGLKRAQDIWGLIGDLPANSTVFKFLQQGEPAEIAAALTRMSEALTKHLDAATLRRILENDDFYSTAANFTPQAVLANLAGRNADDLAKVAENVRTLPKGEWKASKHGASARAEAYELQITGRKGQGYFVNEVEFDGVNVDGLIEAKGPGYEWMVEATGQLREGVTFANDLLLQVPRQAGASVGARSVWHFADERVMNAAIDFLKRKNIDLSHIHFKFTSPVE